MNHRLFLIAPRTDPVNDARELVITKDMRVDKRVAVGNINIGQGEDGKPVYKWNPHDEGEGFGSRWMSQEELDFYSSMKSEKEKAKSKQRCFINSFRRSPKINLASSSKTRLGISTPR